jgi:hypothetical protein
MNQDPEITAMSQAFEALKGLDGAQIGRVLHWIKGRFGVRETKLTAVPAAAVTPAAVEEIIPAPAVEPKQEPKAPVSKKRDLMDFDTVLDLFSESTVKKVSSKILLMAAYLQERHNFKEISSYDINFRLKRIGHGVQNISSSINGILKRKPQLMIEMNRDDSSRRARRKFRVTVEGIKVARGFLKKPVKK